MSFDSIDGDWSALVTLAVQFGALRLATGCFGSTGAHPTPFLPDPDEPEALARGLTPAAPAGNADFPSLWSRIR